MKNIKGRALSVKYFWIVLISQLYTLVPLKLYQSNLPFIMKYLSIFLLATFALAGDAPISTDSKGSPSLIAKFEKTSKSNIEGTIKFRPANNGTVSVSVDLKGLPSDIGPFPYHVHEKPVPASKNCSATENHFNPYNGTVRAATLAAHEVGDLAGKHGNIMGESYKTEYDDSYISLNEKSRSYIGGLSIVIHANNGTRLNCANITLLDEGHGNANTTMSNSSSSSSQSAVNTSSSMASTAPQGNGAERPVVNDLLAAGVVGVIAALI